MIAARSESLTVQLNSALDQLRVATRQRELAEREVLSLKERLRAKENALEEVNADMRNMQPDPDIAARLAACQEQDKKVAILTEEVRGILALRPDNYRPITAYQLKSQFYLKQMQFQNTISNYQFQCGMNL